MLTCLKPGPRYDRRRQVDDDLGGWVKSTVLFLAVSGQKFMKFGTMQGTLRSFQAVCRLSTSCCLPEILALKVAT